MIFDPLLWRRNTENKAPIVVVIVLFSFFLHYVSGFVFGHNSYDVYYTANASLQNDSFLHTEYVADKNPEYLDYCDYLNGSIFINMENSFYLFETPDFTTLPIAYLSPQSIEVKYENDEGWFKIVVDRLVGWTNPHMNLKLIERKTGLYANKNDLYPLTFLTPQVVEVLNQEDNWLEIQTDNDEGWLYLNFVPTVDLLEEFLGDLISRHGYGISVYFENLETGFSYTYNGQRLYFAASVPKVFYAMYLLQLAKEGYVCLETQHVFTSLDYKDGSGVIRKRYPIGTSFSLRELIRLSVSYSDNVASLILCREHGINGFRSFLNELGGNLDWMGWCIFGFSINAKEAGLYAREIFRFIEQYTRYSEMLLADMLNNQYPFIVSDYPVASKTGWTSFRAWHDVAIVFADSPYILVILTERGGWVESDFNDFKEISMAFQEFNETWFHSHTNRYCYSFLNFIH